MAECISRSSIVRFTFSLSVTWILLFQGTSAQAKALDFDSPIPVAASLGVGAFNAGISLTTQLAIYDRDTSRNFYRHVNYSVNILGSLILTAYSIYMALWEEKLMPLAILMVAATVAYGVVGWKYRNEEGAYNSSMSMASVYPVCIVVISQLMFGGM